MNARLVGVLVMLVACAPPEVSDLAGSHRDDSSNSDGEGGDAVTSAGPKAKTPPRDATPKDDGNDGPGDTAKKPPTAAGDAGVPKTPPAAPGCSQVSFKQQVLPAIDDAGCSSFLCHGTRFLSQAVQLDPSDPNLTFSELTGFAIGSKPYVKPGSNDPNDSAIHCHLAGKCGVKMPPGGDAVPPALVSAVDAWLRCGAPKN